VVTHLTVFGYTYSAAKILFVLFQFNTETVIVLILNSRTSTVTEMSTSETTTTLKLPANNSTILKTVRSIPLTMSTVWTIIRCTIMILITRLLRRLTALKLRSKSWIGGNRKTSHRRTKCTATTSTCLRTMHLVKLYRPRTYSLSLSLYFF